MKFPRILFQSGAHSIPKMGRKNWTSDAELKWLQDTIPQFREAQRRRKLADFNEATFAAFVDIFPLAFTGAIVVNGIRVAPEGDGSTVMVSDTALGRKVRLSPSMNNQQELADARPKYVADN